MNQLDISRETAQFIHFPVVQCDPVAITGTLNLFICYVFRIVIAIVCLICRGTHVNKKQTDVEARSVMDVSRFFSAGAINAVKSSKYADCEKVHFQDIQY